jgi:Glycoside hydrolase 123 N-terminal domain
MEKTGHPSRRKFLQAAIGALALEQAGPALAADATGSGSAAAGETRLTAQPEFLRPDPFGGIVRADQGASGSESAKHHPKNIIELVCARGGYASFHLIAETARPGDYRLDFDLTDRTGKIKADLFREWFHLLNSGQYYPDALVPVRLPYRSQLPDPDNKIENQTAQAFWVDIWVPPDTTPGTYSGKATLESGGRHDTLGIRLKVHPAVVPEKDIVDMDHNSYDASWIAAQFPARVRQAGGNFFESDELFRLIHTYHRIFYEHHGVFHQLGYGHAGRVTPEFAPALEGEGRKKRIANWDLYDRHYGPLFDGTAFAGTRRGPKPIPFAYLPINPEWPASYLWWGEPGYETEFVNVVSEMERHCREKGWTQTHLEMFFNQKKRYKGFSWDGDEVRFPKDLSYFKGYGRLLKKALPADTPVKFVFRADVSWDMEQQFKVLNGVVNMWTCGGGILSWYKGAPKMLRSRGDIVWYYGGPPRVTQPSASITELVLRAWVWDAMGFIHWLAVSPGKDPWFHFDGGGTTLVYSGERFELPDPIPSVRLKIQRNAVQDLTLLDSFKDRLGLDQLKGEATKRFNQSTPDQWWDPRPAFADSPPYEWTDAEMNAASEHTQRLFAHVDAPAWSRVRQYIMQLARETT